VLEFTLPDYHRLDRHQRVLWSARCLVCRKVLGQGTHRRHLVRPPGVLFHPSPIGPTEIAYTHGDCHITDGRRLVAT
jgi:hypothetical protein